MDLHQDFGRLSRLGTLEEGKVERVGQGRVWVVPAQGQSGALCCRVLRGNGSAAKPGDAVVYTQLLPGEGCVLGVIDEYGVDQEASVDVDQTESATKATCRLEGQTVHIKATDGLVIECGKGSIVMSGDGRIHTKGSELVSRASGVNRIKGAFVNIN